MSFSIVFQECLSPLSMQALPAPPEALCIVEMGGTEAIEETGEGGTQSGLFLNIGLQVNLLNKHLLSSLYIHHIFLSATVAFCYLITYLITVLSILWLYPSLILDHDNAALRNNVYLPTNIN